MTQAELSAWVSAGASAVALLIPFLMDRLQKRQAERDRRSVTHEIVRAADEALDNFSSARSALDKLGPGADPSALRDYAEKGSRAREVLIHLIASARLSDGAIRLAVDAGALGGETSMCCEIAYGGGEVEIVRARGKANVLATRAARVQSQITSIRSYHKLIA